jgi:crotonobetainyl-CoA:carnitine CoA-transferase CaiB-like acyl-CoA transferase
VGLTHEQEPQAHQAIAAYEITQTAPGIQARILVRFIFEWDRRGETILAPSRIHFCTRAVTSNIVKSSGARLQSRVASRTGASKCASLRGIVLRSRSECANASSVETALHSAQTKLT